MFTLKRFKLLYLIIMGPAFFGASFILTGAGHGIYGPLAILSSPLSLFGIQTALYGLILLWPVIGCIGYYDSTSNKTRSLAVVCVHYTGIILVFLVGGDWNNWYGWNRFEWVLMVTGILYLIANILIWDSIIYKRT